MKEKESQAKEKSELQRKECPPWAKEMIANLREVEIYLGNLPKESWASELLSSVAKRTFGKDDAIIDDHKAEFLFQKIVRSLQQEGFSFEEIARFINLGLVVTKGPQYCNADEVKDACGG